MMKTELHKQSNKRHCMVVHAYYPLRETRVERQAMALLEHGIEVDVICLQSPDELALEMVDGVQVHRLPVRRRLLGYGFWAQFLEYLAFFTLAFARLIKLHLQRRYQVVQVHNLPDFLVFVALFPKLTGAKVILDLHDLMPEFYAERTQRTMDSLLVRLVSWQEWVSCRFADHIITVTELWRQALVERGQPADKVTVVMNVADDHIFNQDAGADAPDAQDERFRLIYHGVMGERHGLDLVLRAIARVRETVPNIHLTLHGGGDQRSALENLTEEMGLQDHVYFSKRAVTTDELPRLIKRADLGIVPYRDDVFTGGILPTKLMEYAALGVPAIAARTPAIAAYFDETTVQFFTPGDVDELTDCILTLYHDRTRLAELARNITNFTAQYNWQSQGANYAQLIDRLQGQSGSIPVKTWGVLIGLLVTTWGILRLLKSPIDNERK